MQRKTRIGFIGAGNMAEALIKGLLKEMSPEQLSASDVVADRLRFLEKTFGLTTSHSNTDVIKRSDVVVLAVKPQVLPKILQQIAADVDETKLIISIAAGVKIEKIQAPLKPTRIIRAMPNVAALVHAAITALSPGEFATEDDLQLAGDMFRAVGEYVVVEEKLMDAVTGLSGSGPGYIFHIINAMTDAGVKVGLSRDVARKLSIQTMYGSAKMARDSGEHPMKLRDMVTSPGGTTIAGIHVLEQEGLTAALMNAVEAATNRSKELGG